ncbi:hypothetical protein M8J76_012016 [Diaphorina citri]|nr:hypothetical protein M8J76_012016 [Diaphorina citri]
MTNDLPVPVFFIVLTKFSPNLNFIAKFKFAVSKITMVDFKVILLSLAFVVALTQAKPFFIDCQSDSDCGVNACCAIGMQNRFGLPYCHPMLHQGDSCRPGDSSHNTTVRRYYSIDPVNASDPVSVTVWSDLCPCGTGLVCSRPSGQQRFALPRCLALTGEGAPCRPGNAPFNTTLYYLSRDSVDFINVWHDLCPCSFGLVCSRDSGVCELPSFHVNNLLDENQWEED